MEGDIPKSPVLSATSGLSSPDVLKRFLMSGQFTNLLNTTDTYSRKVFVGGLPPDIDDGVCVRTWCVCVCVCVCAHVSHKFSAMSFCTLIRTLLHPV